jgi:hypothetical protein
MLQPVPLQFLLRARGRIHITLRPVLNASSAPAVAAIYLNLNHADSMQRQSPNSSYTSIQFFEQRLMVTVRENPEELITQIGR